MAWFFQRRRKQASSAPPSDEEPMQSTPSSASHGFSVISEHDFSEIHVSSIQENQTRLRRLHRALRRLWTRVVTRPRGPTYPERTVPPPPPPSPLESSTRLTRMTTESFERLREIMPACVVQSSEEGYRPADPSDPGYYTYRPTAVRLPLWPQSRPATPSRAPALHSDSFHRPLGGMQPVSDDDAFSIVSSTNRDGYFSAAGLDTPAELNTDAWVDPSSDEAESPAGLHSRDDASLSVSDYNGSAIISSIDSRSILPTATLGTPFNPDEYSLHHFNDGEEEPPTISGASSFYDHDHASEYVSDCDGPVFPRSISNKSSVSTIRPGTMGEPENCGQSDHHSGSVSEYGSPSLVSSNNSTPSAPEPRTPDTLEDSGWAYSEGGSPTDLGAQVLLRNARSLVAPTPPPVRGF